MCFQDENEFRFVERKLSLHYIFHEDATYVEKASNRKLFFASFPFLDWILFSFVCEFLSATESVSVNSVIL